MIIDGNWQLSGLTDVSFNWNTAEYPQIFDEKAVWGAAELLAFPSSQNPDTNKQAAAQEFVKWLSENSAEWLCQAIFQLISRLRKSLKNCRELMHIMLKKTM